MYSLGLLIVDLETARRRLLYVFEVPEGTHNRWNLERGHFPMGPPSIGLLTRLPIPLDLPCADNPRAVVLPLPHQSLHFIQIVLCRAKILIQS